MSEDNQKRVVVPSIIAGVIGAFVAWVGFLILIFSYPDPQGGIGLFISPLVAAPIGVGVGLTYAAFYQEDSGQRVSLLIRAALCIGLPLLAVGSEFMQMVGWR